MATQPKAKAHNTQNSFKHTGTRLVAKAGSSAGSSSSPSDADHQEALIIIIIIIIIITTTTTITIIIIIIIITITIIITGGLGMMIGAIGTSAPVKAVAKMSTGVTCS